MNLTLNTPQNTYTFTLYPIGTNFYQIAGIYIFIILPPEAEALLVAEALEALPMDEALEALPAAEALEAQYSLLYAGITNNFRGRFYQHHKIQQAIALGMTHIGILKRHSTRKRKTTEKDLLKTHNPPLNQTWLHDIPPSTHLEPVPNSIQEGLGG